MADSAGLHRRWPSAADPAGMLLTPESAGWAYAGLHVIELEPGVPRTVATGNSEVFVLPLAGGLTIEVAEASAPEIIEARFDLTGRVSVFDRVTDFAYAGRDSVIRMISAQGAEVALPSARCERRLAPKSGAPARRLGR
jgi:5-deoxy-glucuronate isomerase